ncbi:glutathione S-transferase family protein [Histidinibacterium lentulum]|uniref:Glutathione S-transferase n=1 Tax=Histidinibacterium lentulum TaxID=2480588 RepID=A0A3N2QWG8_9RHOB|nr:glutathione S-transferase N-terminal domain-containing protein [Histidinibacterium lentulum]ROT99405.1 glutathione S-transferase [Histidinibacterium lentulum]
MTALADFPVTERWPAAHPDRIQLYSYPTPNGVKVSIALEELGLPYEPHLVTLSDTDVKSPAFLSLNPNNKIPAIIDPDGPGGAPLALFESGAILVYLADKSGRLMGGTPAEKYEILQWVMFQMGGVGPMFGQLGFFWKFAGAKMEDPTARDRYIGEAKRLLAVVEKRLEDRDWIAGDFSIADIALAPWLNALDFYGAKEVTGYTDLVRVPAYVDRFFDRPAARRGRRIPDPDQAAA